MNDLFQNIGGREVPRDICAQKHGGNEQSKAAFGVLHDDLTRIQNVILDRIKSASFGLSVDDLCVEMNTTPNAISGRITELRIKGKIEKRGTRKTRSGCSAAVWVAV